MKGLDIVKRIGWTLLSALLGICASASEPPVLPVWPNRDAGTLAGEEKVKDLPKGVLNKDGPSRFISNVRNALLGKDADRALQEKYSNELQVTAQTPPTFLVHAKDDPVKVDNSLLFAEALKKAGVPHALQLYDKGGHGYGLGIHGGEVAQWPARCAEWMKELKLVR